ncbi:MAG: L-serine ammonia-lyase [Clostridia bacterium]|nr:L-serine ammonia-lyase [Clostridia bacterium]
MIDPKKIKEYRLRKGLSQRELGKLLCVSDQAISKWEKGQSQPSAMHLIEMTCIFGVDAEDFLPSTHIESRKAVAGMKSLVELYKIGRGPSSSHTMGPERACKEFIDQHEGIDSVKVVLFGSLAKTGEGHGTDRVIVKTFAPIPCKVDFDTTTIDIPHPNTMDIIGYCQDKEVAKSRVMSIGGGSIMYENKVVVETPDVYSLHTFSDIAEYCKSKSIRLWEYALENESAYFLDHMYKVWDVMKQAIHRGIEDEGILPGGLEVKKKAKSLYNNQNIFESAETRENRIVCAFAFAVGEQNADGETVVTAPTCGAAGVVPAVLYYQQLKNGYSDRQIVNALITAGIVGNLIKTNASISGAECGCQAEVGSACSMASAALAELYNLDIDKIEYSAEIAMEHHLGLTCDPICGLVQIPCIERNAVAAMRAINAVSLANLLWDSRKISLDDVIRAMRETGQDLDSSYKETSEGGLAKIKL